MQTFYQQDKIKTMNIINDIVDTVIGNEGEATNDTPVIDNTDNNGSSGSSNSIEDALHNIKESIIGNISGRR